MCFHTCKETFCRAVFQTDTFHLQLGDKHPLCHLILLLVQRRSQLLPASQPFSAASHLPTPKDTASIVGAPLNMSLTVKGQFHQMCPRGSKSPAGKTHWL